MADSGTGEVPDFASLYGDPASGLSPRLAACLWAAAGVLCDNGSPGRRETLVEDLPPLVARVADDDWYDRLLACFDELDRHLASGGCDGERLACCTGEEMALHLMVAVAETLIETGSIDELPWIESLPPWRDDLGSPLSWDLGFLAFGAALVASFALRRSDRADAAA